MKETKGPPGGTKAAAARAGTAPSRARRGPTQDVALQIIERVTDAFLALDREWRFTYVNQHAAEMLGRRLQDLIGKHIWTEFPEAAGGFFQLALEQAMREQTPVVLHDYHDPWGRRFEVRIHPSPDGATVYFQEVTERQRAEEALRRTIHRMERAERLARFGNWELDLRTGTAEWSEGMYLIYRMDTSGPPPTLETFRKMVHPQDLPLLDEAATAAARERSPVTVDIRVTVDGEELHVRSVMEAVLDESGKLVGLRGTTQDITERKRAEEALRVSETRYRALVENASDGIFSTTLERRLLSVNRVFEELVGYGREELLGKDSAMVIAPEQLELTEEMTRRKLAGEPRTAYEIELVRKDGSRVPVEVNSWLVREMGEPAVIYGICRDITERKRAEQALRVAHDRLARAQRISRTGSFEIDVATGRMTFSDEMYRLAGLEPGSPLLAMPEATSQLLFPPEEGLRVAVAYQRLLETGQPAELEYRVVRDGEVRYRLMTAEVAEDESGKRLTVRGTVQDITERKRAEEALRESEAKFAAAFHESPVALVIVEHFSGKFIDLNQAAERLLGWQREEITGRTVLELGILEEPGLREEALQRLAAEGSVRDMELTLVTRSGERRQVLLSSALFQTSQGPATLAGIVDITERKRTEAELRRLLEERDRLARRLLEIREAERGELARELHDGPLQKMAASRAFLEAVRLEQAAETSRQEAHIDEAARQITLAVQEVRRIVADLRPPELEQLGLTGALRQLVADVSARSGLEATFKSEARRLRLPPDRELAVYRIVQEALRNAEKHSGADWLKVSMRSAGGVLRVEVRDSGKGFSEPTTGEGIGLASMRERAELAGATLRIESAPGKGTTVTLELPVGRGERLGP